MAQYIKFVESILFHQLWRSQPTKLMFKPASELRSGDPTPLEPRQQLLNAMLAPINPIDDKDDNLSQPPNSPEPNQLHKELQCNRKSTALASS
jgi:hypothetical protein